MGEIMAKFLKIQDYYINVEQISHVLISGAGEAKSAIIHLKNSSEAFKLSTKKGYEYFLTSEEFITLESYLESNIID